MKPHSAVIRESSVALSVEGEKAVSVTPNVVAGEPGVTGRAWIVVPHASIPEAKLLTTAALHALPDDATSLITTDVGTTPVSVLLVRLARTPMEESPSGVMLQVQHEINCSSGANA